ALHSGDQHYGIYHFAGQPHVNWHQFAVEIFAKAKAQGIIDKAIAVNAITSDQYPTPAKRPANSKLDCSKIKKTFGIEPSDWQVALNNLKDYS
ncbi:sugar nucleotide-binding protein, partial [Shewanella sp.]|uniref:sugar nucleotide-binding protein n=1 Tax=Shewanella sp. TaxID=50422 RepID=UPI003F331502